MFVRSRSNSANYLVVVIFDEADSLRNFSSHYSVRTLIFAHHKKVFNQQNSCLSIVLKTLKVASLQFKCIDKKLLKCHEILTRISRMLIITKRTCGILFCSIMWWVSYGTFRPPCYLIEPEKCINAVYSDARPLTTARLTGTMYGNSILAFSTDFTGPPASLRSFLLSARLPLRITCFLAAIIFTFDLNLPVVLIVWFVYFHLSIQHGGSGLG